MFSLIFATDCNSLQHFSNIAQSKHLICVAAYADPAIDKSILKGT